MTEAEWLASSDPAVMLDYLRRRHEPGGYDPVSDRKLRLFACAACRLADGRDPTRGIEDAEWVADGDPRGAGGAAIGREPAQQAVHLALEYAGAMADSPGVAARMADLAREIVGNPFSASPCKCRSDFTPHDFTGCPVRVWLAPTVLALARSAYEDRPGRKCVRCGGKGLNSGEPHVGVVVADKDSRWLCSICYGTGRIEDGALDSATLTVLADALEEVGCQDEAVLRHLRGEERVVCGRCDGDGKCVVCKGTGLGGWRPLCSPHIRGCWVLDLLLGKE